MKLIILKYKIRLWFLPIDEKINNFINDLTDFFLFDWMSPREF